MEASLTVIWRYMQSTLKIEVKTLKVLFEDLHVPEWIATLFDFNVQNADISS